MDNAAATHPTELFMKDMIDAEKQLEARLQAKGLTAPRVLPEDLDNEIASVHYFTALQGARMEGRDYMDKIGQVCEPSPRKPELGLLTFCVLVLKNGFMEHGSSACASAENFDENVGRTIAFKNAREKLWSHLGFRLRDQLSRPQPAPVLVEESLPPDSSYAGRPVELGDQVRFFERVNTLESSPMIAIVSAVLPDNRVSLSVLAPNGTLHARESVVLLGHNEVPALDLAYYARPR